MAARDLLFSLCLLGAMVWTGGMVAVAVATVAARQVLGPADQVRFFRALGRRYGVVAGLALFAFAGTGSALAGAPADWAAAQIAVAVLTALIATRLRTAARTATALRAAIALVTFVAVLTASTLT